MNPLYTGLKPVDQSFARSRSNDLRALNLIKGDTILGKVAMAIEKVKQDKPGISDTDAYALTKMQRPELFR